MRLAFAGIATLLMTGCTHQVTTSPDTFSLNPGATVWLSKEKLVTLNNAYKAESPVSIPVENHTYVVDQRQMTDTAIAMLRRALEKQGLGVSAQGGTSITLRVHEPTSRFNLIGLAPQFWTTLSIDAELGEGVVVSATHENQSPISVQRAFEGAMLHALSKLLTDPKFIATVNR